MNEGIERLNEKRVKPKNKSKTNSAEPYFYIALILKGTEEQYLSLLKHVNNSNGAQIVYQCKSLTYLRVTRDDQVKLQADTADRVELEATRG